MLRRLNAFSPRIQDFEKAFLAVGFLEEKQKSNSFWKPFFDTFPDRLEEYGYFLTDEDLTLLEGSTFREDLTIFKRLIDDEYREIASLVPEFGEAFTLEEYAFAKVTVISRSFFDMIDGPQVKFLSPIADMLSHDRYPSVRHFYNSTT